MAKQSQTIQHTMPGPSFLTSTLSQRVSESVCVRERVCDEYYRQEMNKKTVLTIHDVSMTYMQATIHLYGDHQVIWPKIQPHHPQNKIYSNFVTSPIVYISYPHRIPFSLHQMPYTYSLSVRSLYSIPHSLYERYRDCRNAMRHSCLNREVKNRLVEKNKQVCHEYKIFPTENVQSFLCIALQRGSYPSIKVRPSCSNSSEKT